MASRADFSPFNAEYPASAFPELRLINRRPCLAYDPGTTEAAYWTLIAPQGITGALTLVLTWIMASAASGAVVWSVGVEAISDGDAVDLDAATSFDTLNQVTSGAVPATAGQLEQLAITLTNADSVAEGDYLRISLARIGANAGDSAGGDAYFLGAELRDAA